MRWLSSFALLLYLSILCTPQAFAVHDQRLSPLADTQFHAVTPQLSCQFNSAEADAGDEPQPTLLSAAPAGNTAQHSAVTYANGAEVTPRFLTPLQARAPPYTSLI